MGFVGDAARKCIAWAMDKVRRSEMRSLGGKQKAGVQKYPLSENECEEFCTDSNPAIILHRSRRPLLYLLEDPRSPRAQELLNFLPRRPFPGIAKAHRCGRSHGLPG